ncbi:hypothetical protein B0H14DRAFT_3168311 [Mycena olivaceomarginata]|nr:hypothetical protein B0H14DRAFT_3168311 [Mycena olivaceomarginata]
MGVCQILIAVRGLQDGAKNSWAVVPETACHEKYVRRRGFGRWSTEGGKFVGGIATGQGCDGEGGRGVIGGNPEAASNQAKKNGTTSYLVWLKCTCEDMMLAAAKRPTFFSPANQLSWASISTRISVLSKESGLEHRQTDTHGRKCSHRRLGSARQVQDLNSYFGALEADLDISRQQIDTHGHEGISEAEVDFMTRLNLTRWDFTAAGEAVKFCFCFLPWEVKGPRSGLVGGVIAWDRYRWREGAAPAGYMQSGAVVDINCDRDRVHRGCDGEVARSVICGCQFVGHKSGAFEEPWGKFHERRQMISRICQLYKQLEFVGVQGRMATVCLKPTLSPSLFPPPAPPAPRAHHARPPKRPARRRAGSSSRPGVVLGVGRVVAAKSQRRTGDARKAPAKRRVPEVDEKHKETTPTARDATSPVLVSTTGTRIRIRTDPAAPDDPTPSPPTAPPTTKMTVPTMPRPKSKRLAPSGTATAQTATRSSPSPRSPRPPAARRAAPPPPPRPRRVPEPSRRPSARRAPAGPLQHPEEPAPAQPPEAAVTQESVSAPPTNGNGYTNNNTPDAASSSSAGPSASAIPRPGNIAFNPPPTSPTTPRSTRGTTRTWASTWACPSCPGTCPLASLPRPRRTNNTHRTHTSSSSSRQERAPRAAKPKRLKAHTVTSKSYSIPMVPRDKKGGPMLPLNVGIMTVISLGDVCMRSIFIPNGTSSPWGTSRYLSTVDQTAEVVYHCTILDGGDGPKFQIIPSDVPDRPVIAGTATGAWSTIVKQANALRQRAHSNSVSGPTSSGSARTRSSTSSRSSRTRTASGICGSTLSRAARWGGACGGDSCAAGGVRERDARGGVLPAKAADCAGGAGGARVSHYPPHIMAQAATQAGGGGEEGAAAAAGGLWGGRGGDGRHGHGHAGPSNGDGAGAGYYLPHPHAPPSPPPGGGPTYAHPAHPGGGDGDGGAGRGAGAGAGGGGRQLVCEHYECVPDAGAGAGAGAGGGRRGARAVAVRLSVCRCARFWSSPRPSQAKIPPPALGLVFVRLGVVLCASIHSFDALVEFTILQFTVDSFVRTAMWFFLLRGRGPGSASWEHGGLVRGSAARLGFAWNSEHIHFYVHAFATRHRSKGQESWASMGSHSFNLESRTTMYPSATQISSTMRPDRSNKVGFFWLLDVQAGPSLGCGLGLGLGLEEFQAQARSSQALMIGHYLLPPTSFSQAFHPDLSPR